MLCETLRGLTKLEFWFLIEVKSKSTNPLSQKQKEWKVKFKIKVGGGIILRSIQVSDAEVALESLSDPDFVKWMSIGPQTLEGIREYYQYMINQAEMMQDLLFAIVYQGGNEGGNWSA